MNNKLNLSEKVVRDYVRAKLILQKEEYKNAQKLEKKLNKVIKSAIVDAGLEEVDVHGAQFKVTYQDRSKMNEEKLLQLLESKGLVEAIKVKKVPDADMIPDLISKGLIKETELAECIDENLVPILKLVDSDIDFEQNINPKVKKSKVTRMF